MSLDLINEEACKALPKPIEKLIECSFNALGRIYEPRHTKKMAEAKAYEIETIAKAVKNNLEIPIEYNSSNLSIDTKDFDDLIERTSKRIGYQELRKQQNIENVMFNACKELDGIDSVTDEQVDNDWMIRLFNSVEDISDEDMQKLWGKVLAGEVVKPKSYSLRTLETLKNLSKEEAELFQKVSKYVITKRTGKKILIANDEVMKKYGVYYSHILNLEDCGLIKSSYVIGAFKFDNKEFMCKNKKLIMFGYPKEDDFELDIDCYKLTKSGEELMNVINSEPNEDYFVELFKDMTNQYSNISFSVHRIIEERIIEGNSNEVKYDDVNLLDT